MKICPQCRTQYTDDSLNFCLQDGASLGFISQGHRAGTTFDSPQFEQNDEPEVATQWRQPHPSASIAPERKSRMPLVILLTAAATIMAVGGGIGAWFLFRSKPNDVAMNANVNRSIPTPTLVPSPTRKPSATPTETPTPTPSPVSVTETETAAIKDEILTELETWRDSAEEHDFESYMAHYGTRVDYYRDRGASVARVRADKRRAFLTYTSLSGSISDVNVRVEDKDTVSAEFDKEWDFEGEKPSSGKVRQELKFKKVNGRWKIVGERDIRLYYKN